MQLVTEDAVLVSEDDLLARVAGGDRRAFESLYNRVAPRLHGLVRRVLVDQAQSEEVTQEVFLEIWETAKRFDFARGKALSWMMTIAHRRAIDRVRASQASRVRDVRVGIRDFEYSSDDVAETVELKEEHRRVAEAMKTLSPLQRDAISLAYLKGLTQTEIAEHLGVPIGTIKTRLRDGLIKLRSALAVA